MAKVMDDLESIQSTAAFHYRLVDMLRTMMMVMATATVTVAVMMMEEGARQSIIRVKA